MPDAFVFTFKYLETFHWESFLRDKGATWWTVALLQSRYSSVSSAPPCGHTCYCTAKKTNKEFLQFILNHSCKSSILKIKCSFHSHFIYKVIFQQRRGGREDGRRFSPIIHISHPHCQSLWRMLLRNPGRGGMGSRAQSHHGPYSR